MQGLSSLLQHAKRRVGLSTMLVLVAVSVTLGAVGGLQAWSLRNIRAQAHLDASGTST